MSTSLTIGIYRNLHEAYAARAALGIKIASSEGLRSILNGLAKLSWEILTKSRGRAFLQNWRRNALRDAQKVKSRMVYSGIKFGDILGNDTLAKNSDVVAVSLLGPAIVKMPQEAKAELDRRMGLAKMLILQYRHRDIEDIKNATKLEDLEEALREAELLKTVKTMDLPKQAKNILMRQVFLMGAKSLSSYQDEFVKNVIPLLREGSGDRFTEEFSDLLQMAVISLLGVENTKDNFYRYHNLIRPGEADKLSVPVLREGNVRVKYMPAVIKNYVGIKTKNFKSLYFKAIEDGKLDPSKIKPIKLAPFAIKATAKYDKMQRLFLEEVFGFGGVLGRDQKNALGVLKDELKEDLGKTLEENGVITKEALLESFSPQYLSNDGEITLRAFMEILKGDNLPERDFKYLRAKNLSKHLGEEVLLSEEDQKQLIADQKKAEENLGDLRSTLRKSEEDFSKLLGEVNAGVDFIGGSITDTTAHNKLYSLIPLKSNTSSFPLPNAPIKDIVRVFDDETGDPIHGYSVSSGAIILAADRGFDRINITYTVIGGAGLRSSIIPVDEETSSRKYRLALPRVANGIMSMSGGIVYSGNKQININSERIHRNIVELKGVPGVDHSAKLKFLPKLTTGDPDLIREFLGEAMSRGRFAQIEKFINDLRDIVDPDREEDINKLETLIDRALRLRSELIEAREELMDLEESKFTDQILDRGTKGKGGAASFSPSEIIKKWEKEKSPLLIAYNKYLKGMVDHRKSIEEYDEYIKHEYVTFTGFESSLDDTLGGEGEDTQLDLLAGSYEVGSMRDIPEKIYGAIGSRLTDPKDKVFFDNFKTYLKRQMDSVASLTDISSEDLEILSDRSGIEVDTSSPEHPYNKIIDIWETLSSSTPQNLIEKLTKENPVYGLWAEEYLKQGDENSAHTILRKIKRSLEGSGEITRRQLEVNLTDVKAALAGALIESQFTKSVESYTDSRSFKAGLRDLANPVLGRGFALPSLIGDDTDQRIESLVDMLNPPSPYEVQQHGNVLRKMKRPTIFALQDLYLKDRGILLDEEGGELTYGKYLNNAAKLAATIKVGLFSLQGSFALGYQEALNKQKTLEKSYKALKGNYASSVKKITKDLSPKELESFEENKDARILVEFARTLREGADVSIRYDVDGKPVYKHFKMPKDGLSAHFMVDRINTPLTDIDVFVDGILMTQYAFTKETQKNLIKEDILEVLRGIHAKINGPKEAKSASEIEKWMDDFANNDNPSEEDSTLLDPGRFEYDPEDKKEGVKQKLSRANKDFLVEKGIRERLEEFFKAAKKTNPKAEFGPPVSSLSAEDAADKLESMGRKLQKALESAAKYSIPSLAGDPSKEEEKYLEKAKEVYKAFLNSLKSVSIKAREGSVADAIDKLDVASIIHKDTSLEQYRLLNKLYLYAQAVIALGSQWRIIQKRKRHQTTDAHLLAYKHRSSTYYTIQDRPLDTTNMVNIIYAEKVRRSKYNRAVNKVRASLADYLKKLTGRKGRALTKLDSGISETTKLKTKKVDGDTRFDESRIELLDPAARADVRKTLDTQYGSEYATYRDLVINFIEKGIIGGIKRIDDKMDKGADISDADSLLYRQLLQVSESQDSTAAISLMNELLLELKRADNKISEYYQSLSSLSKSALNGKMRSYKRTLYRDGLGKMPLEAFAAPKEEGKEPALLISQGAINLLTKLLGKNLDPRKGGELTPSETTGDYSKASKEVPNLEVFFSDRYAASKKRELGELKSIEVSLDEILEHHLESIEAYISSIGSVGGLEDVGSLNSIIDVLNEKYPTSKTASPKKEIDYLGELQSLLEVELPDLQYDEETVKTRGTKLAPRRSEVLNKIFSELREAIQAKKEWVEARNAVQEHRVLSIAGDINEDVEGYSEGADLVELTESLNQKALNRQKDTLEETLRETQAQMESNKMDLVILVKGLESLRDDKGKSVFRWDVKDSNPKAVKEKMVEMYDLIPFLKERLEQRKAEEKAVSGDLEKSYMAVLTRYRLQQDIKTLEDLSHGRYKELLGMNKKVSILEGEIKNISDKLKVRYGDKSSNRPLVVKNYHISLTRTDLLQGGLSEESSKKVRKAISEKRALDFTLEQAKSVAEKQGDIARVFKSLLGKGMEGLSDDKARKANNENITSMIFNEGIKVGVEGKTKDLSDVLVGLVKKDPEFSKDHSDDIIKARIALMFDNYDVATSRFPEGDDTNALYPKLVLDTTTKDFKNTFREVIQKHVDAKESSKAQNEALKDIGKEGNALISAIKGMDSLVDSKVFKDEEGVPYVEKVKAKRRQLLDDVFALVKGDKLDGKNIKREDLSDLATLEKLSNASEWIEENSQYFSEGKLSDILIAKSMGIKSSKGQLYTDSTVNEVEFIISVLDSLRFNRQSRAALKKSLGEYVEKVLKVNEILADDDASEEDKKSAEESYRDTIQKLRALVAVKGIERRLTPLGDRHRKEARDILRKHLFDLLENKEMTPQEKIRLRRSWLSFIDGVIGDSNKKELVIDGAKELKKIQKRVQSAYNGITKAFSSGDVAQHREKRSEALGAGFFGVLDFNTDGALALEISNSIPELSKAMLGKDLPEGVSSRDLVAYSYAGLMKALPKLWEKGKATYLGEAKSVALQTFNKLSENYFYEHPVGSLYKSKYLEQFDPRSLGLEGAKDFEKSTKNIRDLLSPAERKDFVQDFIDIVMVSWVKQVGSFLSWRHNPNIFDSLIGVTYNDQDLGEYAGILKKLEGEPKEKAERIRKMLPKIMRKKSEESWKLFEDLAFGIFDNQMTYGSFREIKEKKKK